MRIVLLHNKKIMAAEKCGLKLDHTKFSEAIATACTFLNIKLFTETKRMPFAIYSAEKIYSLMLILGMESPLFIKPFLSSLMS